MSHRGVLALALTALLIEVGWLALWPLSVTLSHSRLFTTALLEAHAPARDLFALLFRLARRVIPDLADAPLSNPLGNPAYGPPALALGADMLWLAACYVAALWLLSRRSAPPARATVAIVLVAAAVFQSTLLFLPGLFSQDVFSYIEYGRLPALYELNPYVWPPSAVVAYDPAVGWVADVWRAYASPYGPLWSDVQWAMARVFQDLPVADQALIYRALALILQVVNLGLAWALLGALEQLNGRQRVAALAALAWNPLVLFESTANAHNDALMVTFTLLGLWLLARTRQPVLAGASLTLGALVKYLSGLGLIWLMLASVARSFSHVRNGRARLCHPERSEGSASRAHVFEIALVCAALTVAVAAPWLELPDSLDPLLDETGNVGFVNSLPDSLAIFVAHELAFPLDSMRAVERLAAIGAFVAYLVWEVRRVWSDASLSAVARALARSSLLYVLVVSTSTQPWYFCLPMSVVVMLGPGSPLSLVALAYGLLALPALYVSYYLRDATPGWVNLAYGLVPLLLLLPSLFAWARARAHVPAAEAVGDDEQGARRRRVPGAIVEEAGR